MTLHQARKVWGLFTYARSPAVRSACAAAPCRAAAPPCSVLPLGDPRLRRLCAPVPDVSAPSFRSDNERLKASLDAFRLEYGFGRGIAAPQIGIPSSFISLNLGAGTHSLINPVITWRSLETFTLWDDCMCFPHLLVRLRRHSSVSVEFLDEQGRHQAWDRLPTPGRQPMRPAWRSRSIQ